MNKQRHGSIIFEFRARLIADVVTGKLDVREADEHFPELPEEEATDREILTEIESLPNGDLTDELDGDSEGALSALADDEE